MKKAIIIIITVITIVTSAGCSKLEPDQERQTLDVEVQLDSAKLKKGLNIIRTKPVKEFE